MKQTENTQKSFENEQISINCVAEFRRYRAQVGGCDEVTPWLSADKVDAFVADIANTAQARADRTGHAVLWYVQRYEGLEGARRVWKRIAEGSKVPNR